MSLLKSVKPCSYCKQGRIHNNNDWILQFKGRLRGMYDNYLTQFRGGAATILKVKCSLNITFHSATIKLTTRGAFQFINDSRLQNNTFKILQQWENVMIKYLFLKKKTSNGFKTEQIEVYLCCQLQNFEQLYLNEVSFLLKTIETVQMRLPIQK